MTHTEPMDANYLGSMEIQGAVKVQGGKGNNGINKGELLTKDEDGNWETSSTNATGGPYALAISSAPTGTTTCSIGVEGIGYFRTSTDLKPMDYVTHSNTIPGNVMKYTGYASGMGSTPPTSEDLIAATNPAILGIYLGHENEGDGRTPPDDAIPGDAVRVLFKGGA